MKQTVRKLALIFLSTAMITIPVMAQEEADTEKDATSTFPMPTKVESVEGQQRHFGLLAGASDPVEGDYKASGMTAIEVGYQPYIPYGSAIELLTEDFESENSDETLSRTQLSWKMSYNFGGDMAVIRHSYLGLGLGVATENMAGDSPTYGIIYPHLGFDIPLSDAEKFVSLGLDLRYTASASNEVDATSLNGVVKYWF